MAREEAYIIPENVEFKYNHSSKYLTVTLENKVPYEQTTLSKYMQQLTSNYFSPSLEEIESCEMSVEESHRHLNLSIHIDLNNPPQLKFRSPIWLDEDLKEDIDITSKMEDIFKASDSFQNREIITVSSDSLSIIREMLSAAA